MRQRFVPPLLLFLIFFSALALILVRHHNRQMFVELQQLQNLRDDLDIEWGQLQLEHSTLANPARVEQLAREQLGMYSPPPEAVVVINLAPAGNSE